MFPTGAVVLIAGVAGAGKSTMGRMLAERHGCTFCDGDDLHPSGNIAKMRSGTPLEDSDRWPWLRLVRAKLQEAVNSGRCTIVECSGLRARYREYLTADLPQVRLVFLVVSCAVAEERVARRGRRDGHFFPAHLVRSQFEALEIPDDKYCVNSDASPADVLHRIEGMLDLTQSGKE